MSETLTADDEGATPLFQWEALLESSRRFAHACVDNYSVDDAAFFYLHAGASVELAIKAALCRLSPVLLLEGGNRFSDRALLRLVGLRPLPGKDNAQREVFTVGFESAIRRFKLLHGSDSLGVDEAALSQLKAARDVTAHGGAVTAVDNATLLSVLVTLYRVHDGLADHLDITAEEFWGERHNAVARAVRDQDDQLRQQVEALVAAANRRFQQEYGAIDEETISSVIQQHSERLQPTSGWFRTCPVCGATGLSHERAAKRTVVIRRRPRVERGWLATDFRCSVCKLVVPNEDLLAKVDGFDSWAPAEDDLLDVWAEDMDEDLDDEDFLAMGNDPADYRTDPLDTAEDD